MKILGMPLQYFAVALITGIIIAIGVAFVSPPQPADVHKVEITQVPTPEPVYVYVTSSPAQPSVRETDAEMTERDIEMEEAISGLVVLGVIIAVLAVIIMLIMTILGH